MLSHPVFFRIFDIVLNKLLIEILPWLSWSIFVHFPNLLAAPSYSLSWFPGFLLFHSLYLKLKQNHTFKDFKFGDNWTILWMGSHFLQDKIHELKSKVPLCLKNWSFPLSWCGSLWTKELKVGDAGKASVGRCVSWGAPKARRGQLCATRPQKSPNISSFDPQDNCEVVTFRLILLSTRKRAAWMFYDMI